MMLLALMDADLDWEPYRHYVITRFISLEGSKFSTSRNHVILGSTYTDSGLSPDLFRMYAARLFSASEEPDFHLGGFVRYVSHFVCGRLEAAVSDSLSRAVEDPRRALDGAVFDAVQRILMAQARALTLPEVDLGHASQTVEDWVAIGEEGLSTTAPYWWLKTLAVLAYPFMSRWSGALWRQLGGDGAPTLAGFERASVPSASTYSRLAEVTDSQLSRLTAGEHDVHV